jgi:hypothetical protein
MESESRKDEVVISSRVLISSFWSLSSCNIQSPEPEATQEKVPETTKQLLSRPFGYRRQECHQQKDHR